MTLEQAEKKAEKFFAENNYHMLERCCAQCQFVRWGYEGEANCTLAGTKEAWYGSDVAQYGLCDRFECATAEGAPV